MPSEPTQNERAGKSLLFVCTGNICRSPTAEAVMRAVAARAGLAVTADSCGTQGYHAGEPPDPRAIAAAARRGYDLRALRARRIVPADFEKFDAILACDRGHYETLMALAPNAAAKTKIKMLRADGGDLPDPYYGGTAEFEAVLDAVEAACAALAKRLA